MALPIITSPIDRSVLTKSVAITVAVTSVGDSTVTLYQDGTSLGTMTNAGGGSWNYSWTPGTNISSSTLTAVGNVNGTSAGIIVTIDNANTLNATMTAWTQSSTATTVASGITHPDGSGTVYKVAPSAAGSARRLFYTSPTGTSGFASTGFQFWAGLIPGSVTNVISYNDGQAIGTIDLKTEETASSNMYTFIVERKVVGGISWKRIQMQRLDSASTAGTNCYCDIMQDVTASLTSQTYTLASGDLAGSGAYIASPRRVDAVSLPFVPVMRMTAYKDAAASSALGITNAEQWWYKHNWVDTETNMAGGIGGVGIRLVRPSGWSSVNTYPLIVFFKALTDSAETSGGNKTAWQTATIDDYANIYNAIVMVVDERPSEGYWGGVKTSNVKDMFDFYGQVLVPWAQRICAVSSKRYDRIAIGYSKAGNLGVAQILLYPTTWGYVGAWDGAFLNTYPNNNECT